MTSKSSYFLAILLIANPFVLVFFQNCSNLLPDRNIATEESKSIREHLENTPSKIEFSYKINNNLIIK